MKRYAVIVFPRPNRLMDFGFVGRNEEIYDPAIRDQLTGIGYVSTEGFNDDADDPVTERSIAFFNQEADAKQYAFAAAKLHPGREVLYLTAGGYFVAAATTPKQTEITEKGALPK